MFSRLACDCSVLTSLEMFVCGPWKAFKGKKCLSGYLRLFCGDSTKFHFEEEEGQGHNEYLRGGDVASLGMELYLGQHKLGWAD